MKYNAVVIGLGSIGLGYNNDNIILSHSQSIHKHKKFNLIAGVDLKKTNREYFSKKFNKPAFRYLKDIRKFQVDLAIISCPEQQHLKIFLQIIKYLNVRFILIEKPSGNSYFETKKIFKISKLKKINVLINYQRNFDRNFNKIINILRNKKITGFFWYSRGIKNNCSHFINFLLRISKKSLNIKRIDLFDKKNFILYNDKIYINFVNTIDKKNILNECDIMTKNYRITSKDDFNTFYFYKKKKSTFFSNYYEYDLKKKIFETNYKKIHFEVLNNIAKFLSTKKSINFEKPNVETSRILDKIMNIFK